MKEFHGEYKGEALLCNSDDACPYGRSDLPGSFTAS